jgi:hypothetical protein
MSSTSPVPILTRAVTREGHATATSPSTDRERIHLHHLFAFDRDQKRAAADLLVEALLQSA